MRTHVRVFALAAATLGTMLALGAAPAAADPTATIAMPQCCVVDTVESGGSVFALDYPPGGVGLEQPVLVRIDPRTNTVTGSVALLNGHSAGNVRSTDALAVVAGAIWVPAYFENEVLRIDPASMTIAAAIPVGRSPDSVVSDGKSVWV